MTKRMVFSVAAFLAVALLGLQARAAENETERETRDRVQIDKLMWQYIRARDTGNADAYAVKGREALKKMINDFRQRTAENQAKTGEKRPPMYHVIANSYLELVDKDHAHLEAYWMTWSPSVARAFPSRERAVADQDARRCAARLRHLVSVYRRASPWAQLCT